MFLEREQLEKIGFKHLGEHVLLSDKASVYNPGNISIGSHCRIDDFCILSAGVGGIEIGNYVHMGCYASIVGAGKVTMRDYSGLSARVSVFSSSDCYDGEYMTNPCLPAEVTDTQHKEVIIGKHVVVGCGSTILPGVILNDGSAVLAHSLVHQSVLTGLIVGGVPAVIKKVRGKRIFELEKLIK